MRHTTPHNQHKAAITAAVELRRSMRSAYCSASSLRRCFVILFCILPHLPNWTGYKAVFFDSCGVIDLVVCGNSQIILIQRFLQYPFTVRFVAKAFLSLRLAAFGVIILFLLVACILCTKNLRLVSLHSNSCL